jgi:hypothetical protein
MIGVRIRRENDDFRQELNEFFFRTSKQQEEDASAAQNKRNIVPNCYVNDCGLAK